jgi:hypothetical protein
MRAARSEYDAPSVRTADASDIGPRHPARHGQNDREIALGRHNWTFAGSDGGASYCPSDNLLINQAVFAADREMTGVEICGSWRLLDVCTFDIFRLNEPWRAGAWMIGGQDTFVDHAPYRRPAYVQRLSRFIERHLTTLVTFPVTVDRNSALMTQ